MVRYTADEVFKEFIKTLPDKYQKINNPILKDIVYSPWKFLKNTIRTNILEEIRFTYLGVFKVNPKKAKSELDKAEIRFSKGLITEEEYYRVKNMVKTFLNECNE